MDCRRAGIALDGYLDGELDLAQCLDVERHLRSCAACRQRVGLRRRIADAVRSDADYHRCPDSLRARLRATLGATADGEGEVPAAAPPDASRRRLLLGMAASFAAAVVLTLGILAGRDRIDRQEQMLDAVLANHVRSLQAAHLTDIASGDQHTVKPWFNGRLDAAPPVRDLAEAGFPLVGGRLDYLDRRPVAALVYRRRGHVINAFVGSVPTAAAVAPESRQRNGHTILHWAADGLAVWAVSDLSAEEMARFARAFRGEALAPP